MTCICSKPLKFSEKSKRLLKTCGDKICKDKLRNITMLKKLGDTSVIDKSFIDDKLITTTGQLNRNLIKLIPYTIQELYNLYYSIEVPICSCGKDCNFVGFQMGYRQTCGNSFCSNSIPEKLIKEKLTKLINHGDENYNNTKKAQETCLIKYGVSHYLIFPEQINRTSEIMLAKGIYKSDEFKTDFQIYKNLVYKYTNKNPLYTLENFDRRGINDYHLDHKFSISEGFKLGILPLFIGNINNLEMIDATLNREKSVSCSISKKELFNF